MLNREIRLEEVSAWMGHTSIERRWRRYAYFAQGDWRWIAGSVLMLANWPFTLLFIMPTNLKLMSTEPEAATDATRSLLVLWGKLHFVRTCLGSTAALFFLWALSRSFA